MRKSASWSFRAQIVALVLVSLSLQGSTDLTVEALAETTCAAPAKTLSFVCDNKCADSVPYRLTSTATSTACTYTCYSEVYYNRDMSFTFLIPFGSSTKASVSSPAGNTVVYANASNDDLNNVTALKLKSTVASVYDCDYSLRYIGGGNVYWEITLGTMVNVTLASDLLVSQPQVIWIQFFNLYFQPMISKLTTMLPSRAETIEGGRRHGAEHDIQIHLLVSHFVVFGRDLADNKLTELPAAIFNHTKLTTLKMTGNLLKNVSLTSKQRIFLSRLKEFTFDKSSVDTACSNPEYVNGMPFCIIDPATPSPPSTPTLSLAAVIGITVGGVMILLLVIGIIVCLRRSEDGTTVTGTHPVPGNDYDLLSLRVGVEYIKDVKQVGRGAFGDVWLVEYRKSERLASKRMRQDGTHRSCLPEFIAEIKIVSRFDHPNIVKFFGVAWTTEADLQALFEFMEGRDLHDFLTQAHSSREWTRDKLQIAIDVVEALVYVHSFSPPVVHRDLKSRNILLSKNLDAKVTDFGIARIRSVDNTMTQYIGTARWLAPEVLRGSTDYGSPADIFSLGVVLSELDTHTLPYDDAVGSDGQKLPEFALHQRIATGQLTPTFSASCPAQLKEIATQCLIMEPSQRPTASELAYKLRMFKRTTLASF
ncbi:Tkl protein kinase, partial [Globisporangium splendens]